jgi:long-chain acyl-CoA synthetase
VDVRIGSEDRIEIHSGALLTAKIDGQGRMIDPKQKGWFQTEDRGCLERDGTLTVHGRAADFVKVGGEGVSLSRLETKFAALARALRPTEYALLAVHDERLGARIALVTERADEGLVSEVVNEIVSEIVSEFNRGVLPFERIRDVYWVAQIPRSALGKLLRADTAALIGLKLPANH